MLCPEAATFDGALMNLMFAIIFDMDGVLIDSEPSWQEAEIRILGELGVPLNQTHVATTTGWRIDRVVEHWRKRFPSGVTHPKLRMRLRPKSPMSSAKTVKAFPALPRWCRRVVGNT